MVSARSTGPAPSPVTIDTNATVSNTAIGSLAPDSSSSVGWIDPASLARWVRRTAKTAAASVDDTIAPSSRPVSIGRSRITAAASPVTAALTTTPNEASVTEGPTTGRTRAQLVDRPPSKRMSARAATPMP